MADAKTVVIDTIHELLSRRDEPVPEIGFDADIYDEIGLDSLEVAELSAVLEDTFGTDPYSAGILPMTPREIIAFYE